MRTLVLLRGRTRRRVLRATAALTAALAISAMVGIHASSAAARIIYVSTTGNDANAGTLAQPLRTIQKAMSAALPGEEWSSRSTRARSSNRG